MNDTPAPALARSAASGPERFPLIPLLAMALATFTSVSIEMLPTGLMHLMAPDLGVTNAQIGFLMTVFAFTVVISSAPLTQLARRIPRHVLLVSVLAVFALGSIGTAIAPSYELVLATRILTGLAHGVFWAVVASYTALITPRRQLAKGISITAGGGSAAYVLGLPLGTLLGQLFGWRLAFGLLAGLALLVALVLWWLLPRVNHRELPLDTMTVPVPVVPPADDADPSLAARPGASSRGRGVLRRIRPRGPRRRSLAAVLFVCVFTSVVMVAEYAAYSYISPFAIDHLGVPEQLLSLLLLGNGLLSALATMSAGMLFSGRERTGLIISFAIALAGVGLLAANPSMLGALVGVGLWGIGMGFVPPLLQTLLLTVAPGRIRDLSAALYTSGFNLGIGSGAFIGGLLLERLGLGALMPFFLVVVSAAVIIAVIVDALTAPRGPRATR